MEAQKKKNKRSGRLIAGALVGTVLSIGAVAGSASAEEAEPTSVVVVKSGTGTKVIGPAMSMKSGIRW